MVRLTVGARSEYQYLDVTFKGSVNKSESAKPFEDCPIFAEQRLDLDEVFKSELDDSKQGMGFMPSLVQLSESPRYVAFMTRLDQ